MSLEYYGLVRFIEEGLKGLRVGVGSFDGKEFAGSRADHAHDVHAKMVAVPGAPSFVAFLVPAPSPSGSGSTTDGARIALEP